jgi:hypothetical protein
VDLALYGQVLRRFWWLVLGGLILAVALTIFSVARVSSHGLTYRKNQVWKSKTTLLLTQKGKPFGAPMSFSPLTDLYSRLANSDAVRRSMLKAGAHKDWTITATPVAPTFNPGAVLPVIELDGEAPTPRDAVKATVLGRQAFLDYLSLQKGAAGVEVLQNATKPTLAVPRSKTLPIITFLAVLSATFALAFILENVRPSRSKVSALEVNSGHASAAGRRRSQSSLRR